MHTPHVPSACTVRVAIAILLFLGLHLTGIRPLAAEESTPAWIQITVNKTFSFLAPQHLFRFKHSESGGALTEGKTAGSASSPARIRIIRFALPNAPFQLIVKNAFHIMGNRLGLTAVSTAVPPGMKTDPTVLLQVYQGTRKGVKQSFIACFKQEKNQVFLLTLQCTPLQQTAMTATAVRIAASLTSLPEPEPEAGK